MEKSRSTLVRRRQLCTQLSVILRKSRRIASFVLLWPSKLEEISQNCLVFDVVKFQVQNVRKSRRIAAFWMLSSSKLEEVSQNCFVFELADRQIDRIDKYNYNCNYTNILRYIALHYTTLLYTTLHYTTLITVHHNYIPTTATTTTTTATTTAATTATFH